MEKTIRFDALQVGDTFTVKDSATSAKLMASYNGLNTFAPEVTLTKKSNSSAWVPSIASIVRMSVADLVTITLPDPTPEELAAKEHESKLWAARWMHRRLVENIDAADKKVAHLVTRLQENAYDALYWGNETIITAGKAGAYRRVLYTFEAAGASEDGFDYIAGDEAARKFAMDRALEGARHPEQSTAQVANIVKQAETAGYAEIASRNLF